MAKFIEVNGVDYKKHLINVNHIEEVESDIAGRAIIYFAFNCPNAIEQDYMKLRDSYEHIRDLLIGDAE